MRIKLNTVFIPFVLIIFVLVSAIYIRERSSGVKLARLSINGYQLLVTVADNGAAWTQGLSGRLYMPKNEGMLFVFPETSYHYFWMKDMKFPLDFVWINKKVVVGLTENVAKPEIGEKLKTFTARYPTDEVLEINAGVVRGLGIKTGDSVNFSR